MNLIQNNSNKLTLSETQLIYPNMDSRKFIRTYDLSLDAISYVLENSQKYEGDYITLHDVLKYNKYSFDEIKNYKDGILLNFY